MSESNKVDLYYSIAAKRLQDGSILSVNGAGLESLVGDEGLTTSAVSANVTTAVVGTRYLTATAVTTVGLPTADADALIIVDNNEGTTGVTVSAPGTISGIGGTVAAGRTTTFISLGSGNWLARRSVYRRLSAMTSESLGFNRQIASSNRLSSERQPLGTFSTGETAGGDISFELLWGELDDMFASALQGEPSRWSLAAYEAGTDTMSDGEWDARGRVKITEVVATGTGFTKAGATIGDTVAGTFGGGATLAQLAALSQFMDVTIMTVGGTTESDIVERRVARLATATDTALTFDLAAFDVQSGTFDIIIQVPDQIANGSQYYDFSLVRHYSDLGADRALFSGQAVNSMTVTVNAAQAITGTISMVGTNEKDGTTKIAEEISHQWSNNNTMRGSPDTLEGIIQGQDGSMTKFCATSVGLTFNNNITSTDTTCGPVTASGQFGATATLSGLYGVKGKSMYQDYLADADTALLLPMRDDQGRGLAVFLPRGKLSEGQRGTPGGSQNLPSSFTFTGYRDAATARTAIIFISPKMTKFD